jgi:two-component system, OmpR family, heavy metal sensor histidine kinase CusS
MASGPSVGGGTVEVALDRWTDASVLADYREKLSVALAVALLISVATGFLFARRGLAPLISVARRVGAIDARSLEQRLEPVPDAPAEVAALVDSCNAMLARLEGAFAALTHFSAELAHDFRTPLHVMRGQAEVALARTRTPEAYREVVVSNLEEIERLGRLVDDALFLARAEDPRATITRMQTDVGAELAEVAEFLEPLATDAAVSLTSDVAPGLTVVVDRMLFRRALVNLITNAIRHSNAEGRVVLNARATGDAVEVDVADAGEGMPPEAVARASERYYRAPGSEARGDGVGLGLAIVHGVMHLHGGTVRTVSRVGGGTCVTLVFPSADAASAPNR